VFLSPVALLLALLRLLIRSLARTVLAFPRAALDGGLLLGAFGSALGVWIGLRLLFFHHFTPTERSLELNWFWTEARLLFVFPRFLDGVWRRWLGGYVPWSRLSIVKPLLLLSAAWALGLHLCAAALRAARIGFGPDDSTPRPWPTPRLRAPSPGGLLANGMAFAMRLGAVFAFVLLTPPRVRPFWRWWNPQTPMALVGWIWAGLDHLRYPRLLDARMARLQTDYQRQTRMFFAPPERTLGRAGLEMVALEIGVIAATLSVIWGLIWLWRRWTSAAPRAADLALPTFDHAGRPRRAPSWAVVLLPATLPLALAGLAFWKSPLWAPKLLIKTGLLYLVGVVALFIAVWIGLARHASTNWEAMQWLRHWWDVLEGDLRYPAHWHQVFHAIPHGRKERITDHDVGRAVATLCLVNAAAFVPLVVLLRLTLGLFKRTLEVMAR